MSGPKPPNPSWRHHYVTAAHQRSWANAQGLVRCIRRKEGFPAGVFPGRLDKPENVGWSKRLNTLPPRQGIAIDALERAYAAYVDGPAAAAIDAFKSKRYTKEHKLAWCRYVQSLAIRHPDGVELGGQLVDTLVESMRNSGASHLEGIAARADTEGEDLYREALFAGAVRDAGAVLFHGRTGALLVYFPEECLVLGDRPVATSPLLNDGRFFISVPVSPSIAFVLVDQREWLAELAGLDSNWMRVRLNDAQLRCADDFVVSTDNLKGPELVLVEHWLTGKLPAIKIYGEFSEEHVEIVKNEASAMKEQPYQPSERMPLSKFDRITAT